MLLIPLCVSLGVNISDASPFHETFQKLGIPVRETYLEADDTRQQHSRKAAADFAADPDYRYEVLAEHLYERQCAAGWKCGQDVDLFVHFQQRLRNIFLRYHGKCHFLQQQGGAGGRKKIHCFSPSWESVICWSDTETRPTAMRKREVIGDYALAENENVRPICYGVTDLLSRMLFDRLDFWDGLELSQPGPWWRMPGRAEMEMRRISRDIFRDWIRGKCLCRRIWSVCWDPMRGRMSFLPDCGSRCRENFRDPIYGGAVRWQVKW